jgi:hypothetical protein
MADPKSPLVYGFGVRDLPVYFNQAPVLSVGLRTSAPAPATGSVGQNITPNATPLRLSPYEPDDDSDRASGGAPRGRGNNPEHPRAEEIAQVRRDASADGTTAPRVVLQFASNADDLLLSGTLANGQLLAGRAAVIDQPLGAGHVVMFAIRPFWRWQTHGTYPLGFNAILNWNDLTQ